LKQKIAEREKAKEDAESGDLTLENQFVIEVLEIVQLVGTITEPKLARRLVVTNKVIHNVGNYLRGKKLIRRKKNKRGQWIYCI
jgi:hypothetical protein